MISEPHPYGEYVDQAEIDADAWATLNSDTSRPFDRPAWRRIAVKVINRLGDEGVSGAVSRMLAIADRTGAQ